MSRISLIKQLVERYLDRLAQRIDDLYARRGISKRVVKRDLRKVRTPVCRVVV